MTKEQLEQLLHDLGARRISSNGQFMNSTCPIHLDHTPSFGVSLTYPGLPWKCFVCGKGMLVGLVRTVVGLQTFAEAEKFILQYGDYVVPPQLPDHEWNSAYSLSDRGEFNSSWMSTFKKTPRCLSFRGYSEVICKRAGVRYDKTRKRFIIPWKWGGKIIGATSHPDPSQETTIKKAIPLFGFSHLQHLYSINGKILPGCVLYLVESITDAFRMFEIGRTNVVALAGTAVTDNQIKLIRQHSASKIVCAFDGDEPGMKALIRVKNGLPDRSVFTVSMPEGEDPDSLSPRELSAVMESTRLVI